MLSVAMAENAPPAPPSGPPYAPTNAAFGGRPTSNIDIPICAVFLALFICGAVSHMTILQLNLRRKHKFIMSGLLFGFCMARITACILRIAWATSPTNISLAIAANVFVAAGVVLLFLVNLIFTQRILRALQPASGWHPAFARLFRGLYAVIALSVLMVVVVSVHAAFTLDGNARRMDRDVQLVGLTIFATMSGLPLLFVAGSYLAPRPRPAETFGQGRFRSKIVILLASAFLLCLGASFRAGATFQPLRPLADPAWYHSKACFYLFGFAIEIVVVLFYIVVRVDRRFHVPNGSKGPGDYSRAGRADGASAVAAEKGQSHGVRVMSAEEEVLDNQPAPGEMLNGSGMANGTAKETTNGDWAHVS